MTLVDIEGQVEGGTPVIYVKPEDLLEKRFPVPPAYSTEYVDRYKLIASDIIEYVTTGKLMRRDTGILTHGPVAGVGQIARLADMLNFLFKHEPLMVSEKA